MKTARHTVVSFPARVSYRCRTETPEGACGYEWRVDVPADGRPVETTRACVRCGHVSAWLASNQPPPARHAPSRALQTSKAVS